MFLHGDAFAWNSVDVLVDGQLQHGHVMNVVEGGLIIDFDLDAQRSVFVEYGRIWERSGPHEPYDQTTAYPELYGSDTPLPDPANAPDAQVLLRAMSSAAWTWHPGKVLGKWGFFNHNVVLVQVQLPHGVVRELLPEEQVRGVVQSSRRPIVEKNFVIRCCPLPTDYWSEASNYLAETFKFQLRHQHEIRCTAILSQTLLYLQCQTAPSLDAAGVEYSYSTAKKIVNNHATLHVFPTSSEIANAAKKQRKTAGRQRRGLSLPPELLVEILQSLNSLERVRCRRVCPLWNSILTTEANFQDVCVSGLPADYIQYCRQPMFWVVACVLKCLNNRPRTVVFRHLNLGDCSRIVALIRRIRGTDVRLPQLVFDQCQFCQDKESMFRESVGDIIWNLVLTCGTAERVLVKQCRISDMFLDAGVNGQYTVSAQPEALLETQLWDLVEKNLVLKKPLDVQWVVDCIANQNRDEIQRKIIYGLETYQSADPRESTHYRDWQWTVDDVIQQLDVSNLSRVTAAVFSEVLQPDQ
ncbi:uncharacterized protein LOC129596655 [Paramacrobiotus metropolitanus]|uniref:uncharacterized protein LOC129596655 n=1 Tax=Paramacrobiotus metropolitanus TaxID=2943436 RepID=UPI0024456725|nr:uncharacterized protein LOC129596655 [Paramacrobiotus metropolitanus]